MDAYHGADITAWVEARAGRTSRCSNVARS